VQSQRLCASESQPSRPVKVSCTDSKRLYTYIYIWIDKCIGMRGVGTGGLGGSNDPPEITWGVKHGILPPPTQIFWKEVFSGTHPHKISLLQAVNRSGEGAVSEWREWRID